jgi:acetate---CoA ligase (ADP-forming)
MDALERLIRPKSVAIIGASADAGKLTGRPLAFLEKYGYGYEVFPVNPRYQSIGRYPCFPDIRSLPHAPDVAIVLVGSSRVPDAIRELQAIGTGAAIILAGGFGESGAEGMVRQQELKNAAGSMRLLGPNTIGLVNVTDGIALSASAALQIDVLVPGAVALVSQSGGILGSLLSRAAAQGIGFSKLIATGNESDIDVSDLIHYLVDDPATKVLRFIWRACASRRSFGRRRCGQRKLASRSWLSRSGDRSQVFSRQVRIPGRWRDRTSSTMHCSGSSASSGPCNSRICSISRSR